LRAALFRDAARLAEAHRRFADSTAREAEALDRVRYSPATEEDKMPRLVSAFLALAALALAAPPSHADVSVRASFYPGDLDVRLGEEPLLERLALGIRPRGADRTLECAWGKDAAGPAPRLALPCRAGDVSASLEIAEVAPGVVTLAVDLGRDVALDAEEGIRLTAVLAGLDRGTAWVRSEPWWMRPVFFRQQGFLPDETQLVLARRAHGHVALLPLAAGGALGLARGANLPISAGGVTVGLHAWAPWSLRRGPLAVVAAGDSPYALVEAAFRYGLAAMGSPGRMRVEKPYPEPFTHVGFCSWNSFYEKQTTGNLLGAARAFRESGFPIGFLIIDAGWQDATPGSIFFWKLRSFRADPEKIPEGLGTLVRDMRAASGARWIGAWSSLQGTPGGVDPGSGLASEQKASLWSGTDGLVPDPTSAAGAEFYRAYYRRLRESGIDLVKVDFQNWSERYLRGRVPVFAGMQQGVHNLQKAAQEAFDGALINCMSMGNDVLFNLRDTNVVRNSLDYLLPEGPVGHRRHVVNNVFNSLPVQQVAYPDFDMWEAYGDFAVYHSVLRALGGGPVYVTGDVARQDFSLLRRLILSDGEVLRPDAPILPTLDTLYVDTGTVPVPLKGFARVGRSGLLAAFDVHEDGAAVAGEARASDVPGLSGNRFAVLEHFSRRLRVVGPEEAWPLHLGPNGVQLYWIVPVEDGAAAFGLAEKYVAPRTILSREDDGRTLKVRVAEGGTLAVYLERPPAATRVDGVPASVSWAHGLLEVPLEAGPAGPREVEIVRQP
jgi:raffinose synthase